MKQPRVCVSIVSRDIEQAIEDLNRVINYNPDLIEIRLDYLERDADLKRLRVVTELPLIAAYRFRRKGGSIIGSEEERVEWLIRACDTGFDYVDLELNASGSIPLVRGKRVNLILSYHDYVGTPSPIKLEEILDEMLEFKPNICKIIGTARAEKDNLLYLKFIKMARRKTKIISFGMGKTGLISRVLSPLLGGEYTYASVGEEKEAAPGQIPIKMLKELYKLLEV